MFVTVAQLPSRKDQLVPPGTLTLSCTPLNPEEYDAKRKKLHDDVIAQMNKAGEPLPFIYDGSVEERCGACEVRVGVGPRQQLARAAAEQHGVNVAIFCAMCAVVLTGSPGVEAVIQLGNPQEPPQ